MIKKYLLGIITCFTAFALYYILFFVMVYIIPSYHYEKLIIKNNLTKTTVDNTLSMYYELKTSFDTSSLKDIVDIKEGEYFVRYLMLGFPSIDIIYDENDKVVRIFDTYE